MTKKFYLSHNSQHIIRGRWGDGGRDIELFAQKISRAFDKKGDNSVSYTAAPVDKIKQTS